MPVPERVEASSVSVVMGCDLAPGVSHGHVALRLVEAAAVRAPHDTSLGDDLAGAHGEGR
jgi:hypothetical protein